MNNAGIQRRHPFTEFPEQEWNDVIAVNQTAVFLVSQAVTRHMVERKAGKVINICSMQSELGRDTITPYAASKGAVKMLTRGMCRAGAPQYSGQRYCAGLFQNRND